MSSLTRRFAAPTAATLAIVCVLGTAVIAPAQLLSELGPDICRAPASEVAAEASFLAESEAAMKKMMTDMAVNPTGDVDADFVAMMVPHHRGAIDMAVAVLRYGRNPQVRRLAQEIIVTQQQEIAAMRLAVGQPMPPSQPSPVEVPSLRQADPPSSHPADRSMEP